MPDVDGTGQLEIRMATLEESLDALQREVESIREGLRALASLHEQQET